MARRQQLSTTSKFIRLRKDQGNRPRMNRTLATPKKTEKKAAQAPAYKNASAPVAKRVKDLLSRMTLEEKAAQMMCVWQKKSETIIDSEGSLALRKAKTAFKHRRGLDQLGRPSD